MDNGNFEQNDKKIESVYSTRIRAGKRRTYFFDVRATRGNDYFITITESRKRFDNNGYDRHKIFLYKEDFNKFLKAITEAVDHVKTELMPDFDFDAFNHENDGEYDGENNYTPTRPTESPVEATASSSVVTEAKVEEPEHDIDPSTITEKKPLEARDTHASQGDNLSNEEVDKW
ncbi:MAG: hypothetical protein RIR55_661 [Bacteroidota bacterium]|jgi:hypothetical protein